MAYLPGLAPAVSGKEEKDLLQYVERELAAISASQAETIELELRPRFVEPEKPRDGMIVYADGVDWNPGEGVGIYGRINEAWVRLSR